MERAFDEIMAELERDLQSNDQERDVLRRLAKNIQLVKKALQEVAGRAPFALASGSEKDAQILFNRDRLPLLLAKLKFFRKCYDLEVNRRHSTVEKLKLYCERELDKIQQFFTAKRKFCEYYYSGETKDDWQIYKITNSGCLLKATLIAYEQYGEVLHNELSRSKEFVTEEPQKDYNLKIKATETDIVELAFAFHAAKVVMVNGKNATQEFLIIAMRKIFNMPLANWEGLAKNARMRTKTEVKFLERLTNALSEHNRELLDQNPARR